MGPGMERTIRLAAGAGPGEWKTSEWARIARPKAAATFDVVWLTARAARTPPGKPQDRVTRGKRIRRQTGEYAMRRPISPERESLRPLKGRRDGDELRVHERTGGRVDHAPASEALPGPPNSHPDNAHAMIDCGRRWRR